MDKRHTLKKKSTRQNYTMGKYTKYIVIGTCAGLILQVWLIMFVIRKPNIHVLENGDMFEKPAESFNKTFTKDPQGSSADLQRSSVDNSSVMYFEPLVQQDFPTASSEIPRIPHIIHQTHKDMYIPVEYIKNVQTIIEKNPNWTYYFWTDESAERIVAERHPQLLPMWADYKMPLNRADAIRYIALYEFGGFYGDLDIYCKRSLDMLTMKYSCIFPTEPFEQSVFRLHIPYLISNAVMLCRPKHPFLKHMIDSLHQYQSMERPLDIAGPSFVTSQFIRYNNITADMVYKFKQSNESNSPYFYKGNLPEDDRDAVYVPNTQYFISSLSPEGKNETDYKYICAGLQTKGVIVEKACNELMRRLSQNERDKHAFIDHKGLGYKAYKGLRELEISRRRLDSIFRQIHIY